MSASVPLLRREGVWELREQEARETGLTTDVVTHQPTQRKRRA
jgi:hypothetical protein